MWPQFAVAEASAVTSLAGRFAEGVPVETCVPVGHASAEA